MQTWAKRGVQTALVTGGMLAVGTGVASAGDACQQQRPMPLGESVYPPALDDTAPLGRCLAGDLFTEQHGSPVVGARSALDESANELTREIPALRFQESPLKLAGWAADPSEATPLDLRRSAHGPAPITPSEGFHRSLSWSAPIGDVVRDTATDGGPQTAELVIPHDDLVYFDGFGQANGIMELYEGALASRQQAPVESGGLLATDSVDLTDGDVGGLRSDLHTVPPLVLTAALAEPPAPAAAPVDFVPLDVPGERQAPVTEVPLLDGLSRVELSQVPGATGRSGPGLSAPLPGFGELNALQNGQASAPTPSRITAALEDTVLPAPTKVGPRTQLPAVADAPDVTLPMPAISPDLVHRFDDAQTVVMNRI
ncbi:hypothetical protein EIL87_22265 [Saccharopolyspora rhizosphaerae]|uniref:Secreted protein n=1 Tax=Saccharopolyspora rhizosphaerae TaxID=2492662 RepID=A0A3R8QYB3_9PSEU|nr:hypothetical protein [Saccharopolyspora rhizosphaerae]RRO13713.1 hypothetical protein EIL87_22265 [Saccharopolyspora rhizosphaerae]